MQLVEGGLTPSFTEGNHRYHGIYFGEAYGTPIRLIPTARQADATINIYVGTVKDKESNPDQTITSGATSAPIAIAEGVNRIVVEVVGTPTVRHPLYIRYQSETGDRNNNGFTDIYNLEELDAIRNAPDGKYELLRDLDFNDADSYALRQINRTWQVADFSNTTDAGWLPIGNSTTPFTGEFNGNGFTISALRINRNSENDQGLFGSIGSGGTVRDIGLPNVRIAGGNRVGALAGNNAGTVLDGSMVGAISGDDDVGGLVGNSSGAVFNSDALGTVAAANRVGGLVGNNAGQIINSYSDVAVAATAAAAGGLVGNCDNCTMLNSFALGSVTGVGSDADTIGGFVGRLEGRVNVSNNYARGDVRGGDITNGDGNGGFLSYADIEDIAQFNANYSVGATDAGFGGNNINVITIVSNTAPNYWNDDTDGSNATSLASLNASKQTTEQLQRPRSNTGIYARWSRSNWDFGTRNQYPILKYTQNPDNDAVRICDADGLPNCGDLIAPQVRPVLQDVRLAEGNLSPPFNENNIGYYGAVGINPIRIIPTAHDADATINIYLHSVAGQSEPQQSVASGTTSTPITLSSTDITPIVLEVVSDASVVYFPLYIRYEIDPVQIDRDGNGFAEIDSIDELQAINNTFTTLNGKYELVGDLDFSEANSYALREINRNWTVENFTDPSDVGWIAIGNRTTPFTGEFNGNGYTIAGLQINRSDENNQGLFGYIDDGGVVRNLNLYDARVVGGNDVGILAGVNEGTIGNSSVVGTVSAVMSFGGLAAGSNEITGVVFNSNAVGTVAADGHIAGGLIGRTRGQIINSYAQVAVSATGRNVGGLIGQCESCTISNSFALGSVAGLGSRADRIGGFTGNLVGVFNLSNNYAHGDVSGGANRTYGNGGFAGRISVDLDNLDPSVIDRLQLSANYSVGATDEGFVGRNLQVDGGNIPSTAPNYWNDDTDGSDDTMLAALNASKLSTERLQMPTSNSGVYRDWSSDDWDFGTSSEYPILKYAQNPNDSGEQICNTAGSLPADMPTDGPAGSSASTPADLPNCGTLIAPQIRHGLKDLQLVLGELTPPFAEGSAAYFGESDANLIRLIPTAQNSSAMINVYLGRSPVQGEPEQRIASGMTTMPITLATGSITPIVLEIVSQPADNTTATIVHYPLHIRYAAPIIDSSIITEIDSIEALQAINDSAIALASRYRLVRNLDFNDPDSYLADTINRNWIVADFANTTDTGWTAIGNSTTPFGGEFDGNGFTISGLQINRDSNNQGLFGVIAEGGIVRNLGLTEVNIQGGDWVGALAGINRGGIIDVFAIGEISARTHVGGLVGGHLETGLIANSHAAAVVEGTNSAGGLAGSVGIIGGGNPKIVNGYATGSVSAQRTVGGFVGLHANGEISNSYATADVIVVASDDGQNNNGVAGGFVGQKSAAAEISNSYATGRLFGNGADAVGGFVGRLFGSDTLRYSYSIGRVASLGASNVGGFAGQGPGTALSSYWNSQTSALDSSADGSGQTTAELQGPTGANGIYADWSSEAWDFGNATQYPILNYAQSTTTDTLRACDGDGLPNCGDPIAPQIRNGLSDLRLAGDDILFPPFAAKHSDLAGNYSGSVAANPIRLIPTARQDNTIINIHIGTVADITPSQSVVSGEPSAPITLRDDGITPIILEIVGTPSVRYPLYIRYQSGDLLTDRDNNGFAEIYYLEDLHAIATDETTLADNYELLRNLDFNNPDSYLAGGLNLNWARIDFDNTTNTGWLPIGSEAAPFVGEFEGNGFAIANLQIKRDGQDFQGLFGYIGNGGLSGNGGAVRNLGVVGVRIEAGNHVGAIAGDLRGSIANSYANGSVSGELNVGGLVGNIGFYTPTDADTRPDVANAGIIVNSRSGVEVEVSDSNVGGMLGRCNGCTVLNSFAVGTVGKFNTLDPTKSRFGIGGFIGQAGETLRISGGPGASQAINISNNYTQGNLLSRNPNGNGSFLGNGIFGEAILNANYATGSFINPNTNQENIPQFVELDTPSRNFFTSTVANYFRDDVQIGETLSDIAIANAFERTGQVMRAATAPGSTATGVYYLWSEDNWDFGNAMQYPILKYTSATDVLGVPACRDAGDMMMPGTMPSVPTCGTLIAPKTRYGLSSLVAQGDAATGPAF